VRVRKGGMVMSLKKFLNGIDRISEWSGRIFIWLVIPLTILVVYEVISRRFLNAPHIWAPEVIDFI
jgi:TRAP-type mannitol/chloroaromatic compound transport system permease small subunit